MITFRCPPVLLALLDKYVRDASDRRVEGELTRSDFVLAAVREKLDHLERSKRKRPRKSAAEKVADNALALVSGLFATGDVSGESTPPKERAL